MRKGRSLRVQPDCLKDRVVCGSMHRSLGINRKCRVLFPGPGFLSSSTWPLMPKNNSNGLINQSNEQILKYTKSVLELFKLALGSRSEPLNDSS